MNWADKLVQESFAARIKGDFESLSLAIANLPVGIIPFPDRAKAALQKLNTDIVHGVTSGNLDVVAIAADKDAVAAALAPVTDGAPSLSLPAGQRERSPVVACKGKEDRKSTNRF